MLLKQFNSTYFLYSKGHQKAITERNTIMTTESTIIRLVIGALMIGLSAGIGEEVLIRGAIQPRYGIVLAAAAMYLACALVDALREKIYRALHIREWLEKLESRWIPDTDAQ